MVLTKIKRLWAVALGVVLTILAIPADAVNGYTNVSTCACVTTADFAAAAINQVTLQGHIGTYTVISSTHASSAYMYATPGKWVGPPSERNYFPPTATPVDANGNSIAGLSESAQEAVYSAIDINIMMAERSGPVIIGNLNLSPFFSTSDADLSTQYFNQLGAPLASQLQDNQTVTLIWKDGSGIVALYIVVWLGTDHTVNNFALKFKSATKNGQPIDRNGNPINNPNTSGKGGGSASVPGFGPNAGINWDLLGQNECSVSSYAQLPDGTIFGSASFEPC